MRVPEMSRMFSFDNSTLYQIENLPAAVCYEAVLQRKHVFIAIALS